MYVVSPKIFQLPDFSAFPWPRFVEKFLRHRMNLNAHFIAAYERVYVGVRVRVFVRAIWKSAIKVTGNIIPELRMSNLMNERLRDNTRAIRNMQGREIKCPKFKRGLDPTQHTWYVRMLKERPQFCARKQ